MRSASKSTTPERHAVIAPAGDFQIGNLATPVNASPLVLVFLRNLPAYRPGLTPFRRGLEVGMAHGYWLLGPFFQFGPFREAGLGNFAALLGAIALVILSTAGLWLYAFSNPPVPGSTGIALPPPADLTTTAGWQSYGFGFLIGGIGGVLFAYLVLILVALHGLFF